MRKKNFGWGVHLSLTLASCSWGPVSAERDPHQDLAHYKTFSWLTPEDAARFKLSNPQIKHSADITRIERKEEVDSGMRAQMEAQLQANGFTPAPGTEPDFYATFYEGTPTHEWISSWSGSTPSTNGVPLVIFPELSSKYAEPVRETTIFVAFYDAKTGRGAWSGKMVTADRASAASVLVKEFAKTAHG
jgi:hypothetical protein